MRSSQEHKNKEPFFHFLSYNVVIKELKIGHRPTWQKKIIYPIYITFACIWGLVPIVFIVGLVVNGQVNKDEWAKEEQAREAIVAECDNKAGDYDLYYDNGNSELPICRTPQNEKEWKEVYRMRAYREGLRNGDVDPPSLDENCYTNTICQ